MHSRMNSNHVDLDESLDHVASQMQRVTRYGMSNPPIFDRPRSTRFVTSVAYQVPMLWAALPNDLKFIADPDRFNSQVRKLIWKELEELDRV